MNYALIRKGNRELQHVSVIKGKTPTDRRVQCRNSHFPFIVLFKAWFKEDWFIYQNPSDAAYFQNPRETSSRSRIFLISLAYVCMYLFMYLSHASWPNEKRYRPEIWYKYSHGRYLETGFLFFRKNDPEGC